MRWWRFWDPPCMCRTVIVNLRNSDEAIRGVLWSTRGAWWTLKNATLLVEGREVTPLDGEVVIERKQILFVQVMP